MSSQFRKLSGTGFACEVVGFFKVVVMFQDVELFITFATYDDQSTTDAYILVFLQSLFFVGYL